MYIVMYVLAYVSIFNLQLHSFRDENIRQIMAHGTKPLEMLPYHQLNLYTTNTNCNCKQSIFIQEEDAVENVVFLMYSI